MTANQAKPPSHTKGMKTEREKRLSIALREELAQAQIPKPGTREIERATGRRG